MAPALFSGNQRLPSGSHRQSGVAAGLAVGMGNSVMAPLRVMRSILPLPLPDIAPNQRLPSGPTVSAPGHAARGARNSVTAPEGVIRPIADGCPVAGSTRGTRGCRRGRPSGAPGAMAFGERELGDGARWRDPADRSECRLGEPEVAVGADRQVAWESCRPGSGNSVMAPAGVIRPIRRPVVETCGEPEVAVGADRQVARASCRSREAGTR